MRGETRFQAAIYANEEHIYDVYLGAQPEVTWRGGWLSIRVCIPYDGRIRYRSIPLKDLAASETLLRLGQIGIVFPRRGQEMLSITMPAGDNLPMYIKGRRQVVMRRNYSMSQPQDTLIAIHGEVFDGGQAEQAEVLEQHLIVGNAFVNDLRLRVSLWVPDLNVHTQQERANRLQTMLLQRENDRQLFVEDADDVELLSQRLARWRIPPAGAC
jgi:hypothetical protein